MWQSKKTVHCPVCKGIIGTWNERFEQGFVCSECQWIFYFDPNSPDTPRSKRIEHPKDSGCGCGGCGR